MISKIPMSHVKEFFSSHVFVFRSHAGNGREIKQHPKMSIANFALQLLIPIGVCQLRHFAAETRSFFEFDFFGFFFRSLPIERR